VAALILSRAEYLVILDILHAPRIFGLDNSSLFPADRDAHLELIEQGIHQLEARQLVRIENGHHIIERRLLEIGVVVTRPQLVITTIRDRAGIGGQLYIYYQVRDEIVEMVLPDEDHYSFGQLPDVASAMDRIIRILDLPDGDSHFSSPQSIERDHLYHIQTQLEYGDRAGAMTTLIGSGWPEPYADGYLAALAHQRAAGLVNFMAPAGGRPGEMLDLTLIQDGETAWLVTAGSQNQNHLLVRQVNAAAFRLSLEAAYDAVSRRNQEQH